MDITTQLIFQNDEISIFKNILYKEICMNRQIGFNKFKLTAEETKFLESIYKQLENENN